MADLSNFKTNDRKVEILNPVTDEPIGVRVTIMSVDDPRMTKIKRRVTDERLRLDQRGKNFKAEDIEENRDNILIAAMIDWEWYNPTGKDGDAGFDPKGQATFHDDIPSFDHKHISMVFNELSWFRDQINEATSDTKAFFNNSKSN